MDVVTEEDLKLINGLLQACKQAKTPAPVKLLKRMGLLLRKQKDMT